MDDIFLDEKYLDFLLLAVNGDSRHYSFRVDDSFNGIIDVEDIPANYPRLSIANVTIEKLRAIRLKLIDLDWDILIDHLDE